MTLGRVLLGASLGAGLLAVTSVSALAAVVCNGNVCWHAHESYDYPPTAGVVVHEDTWAPGPGVTFREHDGRGYWKGGAWTNW
jgi:hypothetical protein